ncbi:MAG: 3-dehydroquinate synthase, partial [Steroidobacteraceae bacterium]
MKTKEAANVVELPGAAIYQQEFTLSYNYPVYFTAGVFARANPVFVHALSRLEPNKRHRFVVFIDGNVAASWPALAHSIAAYAEEHAESLQLVASPEVLPAGEQVKNDITQVTRLQHRLSDLGIDRHSYVVGIGGGALLDMVGFAAATTHRGVRHVRVPTTVLAQNDAG